jgi:hypothetical protein
MKRLNVVLLVLSFMLNSLQAQMNNLSLEDIPEENVYLHTNTNFLLAGEYLYYQIYNILPSRKELSSLSKIGYVDLINEVGKPIFQHKLILKAGVASSEFFVPADLPSGNYKLVGYTNWMRNFPKTSFTKDITILNPYLGDQKTFLSDSAVSNTPYSNKTKEIPNNTDTNTISIGMARSSFGKREKVDISLTAKSIRGLSGSYSISVRKIEPFPTADNPKMRDIILKPSTSGKIKSYEHLPETKGTLITGKLTYEPIRKIANQRIMLSFPGETSVFKIATTDSTGLFRTQLSEKYTGNEVLIQNLNGADETSNIELDMERHIDYDIDKFYSFHLDQKMEEYIIERSIQNQIENAYFEIKPDSVLQKKNIPPFYDGEITTYNLDDYTRFSTLKETFVEILDNVWIGENEKGKASFKVRYFKPLQDSGEPPLVFLDGAYIYNHDKLLGLPSKNIEKIKVGRDQYLYGSHSFQGIIDIYTFEGNAYMSYLDSGTVNFSFEPHRIKKYYYKEDYSANLLSAKKRLPDLRNQLLWLPEIITKNNIYNIHFYTSDVVGKYEVVLEGITNTGIPVTAKQFFTVD